LCVTSSNNSSRAISGFTLIEILLAITLLGIVTTALYGSYFTVTRARERATQGIESRRELGATLDLIRREVAATLYRPADKRLHLVVEDRDLFGKPSSTLEFTTLMPASAGSRKESGIALVRYQMNDQQVTVDKTKPRILTRREQDLLFDLPDLQAYPQMERISSFLVECYDGSKWVKTWDTKLIPRLPSMLRITVQVEENGALLDFSMLAPLRVNGK